MERACLGLASLFEDTGDERCAAAIACLRSPVQEQCIPAGECPPLAHALCEALVAMPTSLRHESLAAVAKTTLWRTGSVEFPTQFVGQSAVLEIIGPHGLAVTKAVRGGLFLQSRDSYYPPHSHSAEEFYVVLSGNAKWQKGNDPFQEKLPGALIHHSPGIAHAMQTGKVPLLAAWIWMGEDLSYDSYRLD
ncbi:MAG: dimethylsulfonioproprionate lyase family protein [Aestuariivirga sp.]